VANAMPKGPPMRMWVDDQRAYSMNEIAINWNAPLVFTLAAANAASAAKKTSYRRSAQRPVWLRGHFQFRISGQSMPFSWA
jgi:hypothetical protein